METWATQQQTQQRTQQKTQSANSVVNRKLIYAYMAENKWFILLFIVVASLTLPVEAVLIPQFYSKLITHIRASNVQAVQIVLLLILLLWVVVLIFTALKASLESRLAPGYLSFARKRMFKATVERYRQDYQDIRIGEHLSRILDVSRSMRDIVVWSMSQALPVLLVVLGTVIYFLTISPLCGAVIVLGSAVTFLIVYYLARRCVRLSNKRESFYLMMSEKFHDSFGNLMNIYLNNADQKEIKRNNKFEVMHMKLYQTQQKAGRTAVVALCFSTLCVFTLVGILLCRLWRRGEITAPTFTAAWIVLMYYLSSQVRICTELPLFLARLGILDKSSEFLADLLQAEDKVAQQQNDVIQAGRVEFSKVSFKYPGTARPVLRNFSMEVDSNEKVAVIGTSGSGKTTAMKLLVGMYPLTDDASSITVDGVSVTEIDLRHLRAKVNYVNQRTQLFHTTVLKNIQYGNPRVTEQKVLETLEKYNFDVVFQKLKDGVHTDAGVHGGNLSLGMQKVVMLLRGLYKPSKIVILDEPLAGLDASTRKNMMRFIVDMCDEKTLIVITHDQEIIPLMDRVVNLNKTTADAGASALSPPPVSPPVVATASQPPLFEK
jgi:ABC-type multidrug transport system fused ATPase/permease subunit